MGVEHEDATTGARARRFTFTKTQPYAQVREPLKSLPRLWRTYQPTDIEGYYEGPGRWKHGLITGSAVRLQVLLLNKERAQRVTAFSDEPQIRT
jgi:hypothetical protein